MTAATQIMSSPRNTPKENDAVTRRYQKSFSEFDAAIDAYCHQRDLLETGQHSTSFIEVQLAFQNFLKAHKTLVSTNTKFLTTRNQWERVHGPAKLYAFAGLSQENLDCNSAILKEAAQSASPYLKAKLANIETDELYDVAFPRLRRSIADALNTLRELA